MRQLNAARAQRKVVLPRREPGDIIATMAFQDGYLAVCDIGHLISVWDTNCSEGSEWRCVFEQ